jgi:IrrE N-terminal-like domain
MMNRRQVAMDATATALRLRRKLGYQINESISPIDAAEKLGIDVRFVDLPSMEGMYVSGGASAILLSALRPPGRIHFTCAHEIGHHAHGHGDQFDELVQEQQQSRKSDTKEYQADTFASYFLMPRTAVEHGLHIRSLTYAELIPTTTYALANWLGVGYATLVHHLFYGLSAISTDKWSELNAVQPKQIRERLINSKSPGGLWIVDHHWKGRAVDVEVGDTILVPKECNLEGIGLASFAEEEDHQLIRAVTPSISRLVLPAHEWSAFVRVSRKNFTGRSCFRFDSDE